jgi:hypothetical protein
VLTFEDARQIVDDAERERWRFEGDGEFFVAPWGEEDATHYCVHVGAREWLVDGDIGFCRVGDPVRLVSKRTGEIELAIVLDDRDRFAAMTPVGDHVPSR